MLRVKKKKKDWGPLGSEVQIKNPYWLFYIELMTNVDGGSGQPPFHLSIVCQKHEIYSRHLQLEENMPIIFIDLKPS